MARRPGESWTVRKANPMIPPARWDEEYAGATGFQLGRIEVERALADRVPAFGGATIHVCPCSHPEPNLGALVSRSAGRP